MSGQKSLYSFAHSVTDTLNRVQSYIILLEHKKIWAKENTLLPKLKHQLIFINLNAVLLVMEVIVFRFLP